CFFSSRESVAASAVVPKTTRKLVPFSILNSISLVKDSKSTERSSLKGVTNATPTPFSIFILKIYSSKILFFLTTIFMKIKRKVGIKCYICTEYGNISHEIKVFARSIGLAGYFRMPDSSAYDRCSYSGKHFY